MAVRYQLPDGTSYDPNAAQPPGKTLNSPGGAGFLQWLLQQINPIGSAQAAEPVNVSPDMPHGSGPGDELPPIAPTAPAPAPAPAAQQAPPPGVGFDVGGPNWSKPPAPALTTGFDVGGRNWVAPPPTSSPGSVPLPPVRPRVAGGGAIDPATVNLGYYRPTTGNARGSTFMPQPADAPGTISLMGGRPITAADWSGLFKQPATVGPLANVPAANAQPVSAAAPRGALNLGASYNLPGSGYRISPNTGDVYGTLWGQSGGGNPY